MPRSTTDRPFRTPIPPEAPSDHPQPHPETDSSEDYDLNSAPGRRFDEATPLQLEHRGLTQQPPGLRNRQNHPEQQPEFWAKATVWKNTVAAKLRAHGRIALAQDLEFCHSTFTVGHCNDCGQHRMFPNRCDRFYCPECQPRLAYDRRRAVEWWTKEVHQPKHVVLTVTNITDLTRAHVHEFKNWWTLLRRRKFARSWLGGFYSIEVTNEGNGWHLHLHALIDAKWIDASQLAREWSSVCRGYGHIVKVKDARETNYLGQVTKYAVKGNDLACWTPDQIVTFIDAFDGIRCFTVFGSLYGKRTEWKEWIDSIRDAKPRCPCGSCNVSYFSEHEWLMLDLQPDRPAPKPRPPPPDHDQPNFEFACGSAWPDQHRH